MNNKRIKMQKKCRETICNGHYDVNKNIKNPEMDYVYDYKDFVKDLYITIKFYLD